MRSCLVHEPAVSEFEEPNRSNRPGMGRLGGVRVGWPELSD